MDVKQTATKGDGQRLGEIEEGGELDSHEEVRIICVSRRDQEDGGELDSHEES